MLSRSESCGSCSWNLEAFGGGRESGRVFDLMAGAKEADGVIARDSIWHGANAWLVLLSEDTTSDSNLTSGEAFSGAEGGSDMSRTLDQLMFRVLTAWTLYSLSWMEGDIWWRKACRKPTISANLVSVDRLVPGGKTRHYRRQARDIVQPLGAVLHE